MGVSLSPQEFLLLQKYICGQCGILIPEEKAYLVESRLGRLLAETGARSFSNLYLMLNDRSKTQELASKVIEAITTKETQWFRDKTPWYVLEDLLLPAFIQEMRQGKRSRVRIWSAACATGQEPYSTAMCIDRYLNKWEINDVNLARFEILATDISQEALQAARAGKYDNISISRGLGESWKAAYFRQEAGAWLLEERIREAVRFQRFNLGESYAGLGQFDIIFCRYVTIYFTEEFKREVLRKMAAALTTAGVLFLGNSEILVDGAEQFKPLAYKGGVYYQVRRDQA